MSPGSEMNARLGVQPQVRPGRSCDMSVQSASIQGYSAVPMYNFPDHSRLLTDESANLPLVSTSLKRFLIQTNWPGRHGG